MTRCSGPAWKDHATESDRYSLQHLHPFEFVVDVDTVEGHPGRPGKPAFSMTITVQFSHHCFSTSLDDGHDLALPLLYTDTRRGETRAFCPSRWELSKRLPGIIRSLRSRCCYLTGRDNFFTVEEIDVCGRYTVYFNIRRLAPAKALLYVESAYRRSDAPHRHHAAQKIGLNAILQNVRLGARPHRTHKN